MATSSDNGSAIIKPCTPEYKSALEKIYGQPGVPEEYSAPLDWLGRKKKETQVPMKIGELDEPSDRKVVVLRDHLLELPELNLRVALIGPPIDTRGFPALLTRAYCTLATDIYDADLVIFTGGLDVEPIYYDEKPHPTTVWDEDRDLADIQVYLQCLEEGIPMAGVCRGAQFLAVMNGAKLFQDIDGHQGDHSIFDVKKKETLSRISSVHHQCVRPCEGMEIIAYSHQSTFRWENPDRSLKGRMPEIEAFFFRDTCCFGVQGHPEYKGYNQYAKWFLDYINEFVILNEDIDWRENDHRRMRKELIKERTLVRENKKPTPTLSVIEGGK